MSEEKKPEGFIKEKVIKRPRSWKEKVRALAWVALAALIFGLVAGGTIWAIQKLTQTPDVPPETTAFTLAPQTDPEPSTEGETEAPSVPNTSEADESGAEGAESTEAETTEPETTEPETEAPPAAGSEAWKRALLDSTASSFVTVTETGIFGGTVERRTQCTGVILGRSGQSWLVLVPYAPIASAERLAVRFPGHGWEDAQIAGLDNLYDLAVVRVTSEAQFAEGGPKPIVLGNSYALTAQSWVVAVGSPYGIDGSAQARIIGSQAEENSVDSRAQILFSDMGTSKSGLGFLLDEKGRLVGLLTSHYSGSGDGFLTRSLGLSDMRVRIQTLCQGKNPAYLGVRTAVMEGDPETAGSVSGLVITEVLAGSPAFAAGLQAGDVFVSVGEKTIGNTSDLMEALAAFAPDMEAPVEILRQGREGYAPISFTVTFRER